MVIKYAQSRVQEQEIEVSITYCFTEIFPRFFTKEEINELKRFGILQLQYDQLTRDSACRIQAALTVLISIIEMNDPKERMEYRAVYQTNIKILERQGLCFPFPFERFAGGVSAVCKEILTTTATQYVM